VVQRRPGDIAAKYPSAGMCTHGSYREADASLDGTPVAAVHTFPHIYTGGIVPTLWRPIPAIHTFSLYAERVDVTPFVGRLVDGNTHDLAFTVQNNGDSWSVVATLLLYTDHGLAQTHGALTTDTVAPAATGTRHRKHRSRTTARAVVDTTSRNDVTAGYVDTSSGRVYSRVVRTMAYRNDDTVTANGLAQHIVQHDSGTQTSTANGRVVNRHAYDYPITIDYSAAAYVDDQNFSLTGTVDMIRPLVDSGTGASTENVHSYGILSRVNGVNTESDGNSTSFYAGPGYVHYWRATTG